MIRLVCSLQLLVSFGFGFGFGLRHREARSDPGNPFLK